MSNESIAPILINGQWRPTSGAGTFSASNPASGEVLDAVYPVSNWEDVDAALDAAGVAFAGMRDMPSDRPATFLRLYANAIEARCDAAEDGAWQRPESSRCRPAEYLQ